MRPLGSKSPMCLGTVTLIRYQLKGAAGLGGEVDSGIRLRLHGRLWAGSCGERSQS